MPDELDIDSLILKRDASIYEAMILGGKRSPGVVKFSGHDRKIGWDIKKAPGQSGARTERTSEDPIEFEATFYLADEEDFAAWPEFLALAQSTISGKEPVALDAQHPDLAEVGIKSVVLATQGGPQRDDDGGETRVLRFLEYKPPAKKTGTPWGAKPKIDPKDPNAEALRELDKLTTQYEKTPWG